MNEQYARSLLIDTCRRLYDRNLTVSAGGNMSMRVDDYVLITPSGRNKGLLREDELVKMSLDGKVLAGGKPSIEHRFHLALYNKRPEVNAIVHCHPLYCTTLAVIGKKINTNLTPEGVLLLGDVPMIPYYTPGSDELVKAVEEHSQYDAMLMAKHGALTQGKDIEGAYNRMEELEFQAHMQLLAKRARNLPKAEIQKIRGML